jgi:hypothetical protein
MFMFDQQWKNRKASKGFTKAQAENAHTKKRAEQRYNIFLNRHDLRELALQIQNGQARFVEKQSNRVSVWDVSLEKFGLVMRVPYDKKRARVITIFPPEALQQPAPLEAAA